MAIAGFVGSALYLKFGSTELQTYYRTAGPSEEIDLVEKTAGADANKTYLATVKDGTMDIECVAPETGTAVWAAVVPGTSGTLEWGPEGTAAGKPKHSVLALVRSRGKPLTYNDLTTFAVTFQFNGAISDTVYP